MRIDGLRSPDIIGVGELPHLAIPLDCFNVRRVMGEWAGSVDVPSANRDVFIEKLLDKLFSVCYCRAVEVHENEITV